MGWTRPEGCDDGSVTGFICGVRTVTDPGTLENPFTAAGTIVDGLANPSTGFVTQEILKNRIKADEAYDEALLVLEDLKSVKFEVPTFELAPSIDPSIPFDPSRPVFVREFFERVDPPDIGDPPPVDNLPTITAPDIPDFNPSIDQIIVPQPPEQRLIPTPGDPPGRPEVEFPKLPTISYPDEPLLSEIQIPEFDGVDIPDFDPEFPTINDPTFDAILSWTEPTYTREIIDEILAKIRQMLDGGLAIDPDVEQGIVDRARDREDRLVRQAVSQAMDEVAGRGFSSPPGILIERIDNIREEGLIKKLGLNREVMIKIFDEELANMRLAVQQGIVAEELFIRLFLAATERLFLAARLSVENQIQLYNLQVTIYNARIRQVEVLARVYEVQVNAALAEIEVFKSLVQAELAKAEVNKALVDMYQSQIEARKLFVDIYEAQVRATAVQFEAYATDIQAYRGKVEAYAAEIGAEKLKFDAYEAQVRGETAKATIIESEARAYAANIEGISSGVTAEVAALRGEVSKIEAGIAAYSAGVQGKTAIAEIELRDILAQIQGYDADIRKYIADSGIIESENRVITAAWEAANRTNLAYFEAQVAKYRAVVEALAQQASVALGALSASGDIASTITAGALAAMHLGATVNGSGSVNATGTNSVGFSETIAQNESKQCSTSKNTSVSTTSNEFVDLDCP